MLFDHLSADFIDSQFGPRNCSAHTAASCKTLRDSRTTPMALSLRERWKWTMRARLGPRHAHSIPGQGLSDHHYRLYLVRICVELSFHNPLEKPGNLAPFFTRTGQSNYTVSTFPQLLIIFSLERQDKTQAWEKTPLIVAVVIMLRSSLVIQLIQQHITEQKTGSFFIAFISLLFLLMCSAVLACVQSKVITATDKRNLSKMLLVVTMTKHS